MPLANLDVGFATCVLVADTGELRHPRAHGGRDPASPPTSRCFSRPFEDLVVHDAVVGNKQAAADRHGVSWRAVNNACLRVATEALAGWTCWMGLSVYNWMCRSAYDWTCPSMYSLTWR